MQIEGKFVFNLAVIVAQLAKQSLLLPEVCDSNSVIGKIY